MICLKSNHKNYFKKLIEKIIEKKPVSYQQAHTNPTCLARFEFPPKAKPIHIFARARIIA